MVLRSNKSTLLGIALFVAFVLQYMFNLQWHGLFVLQQEEMYKRWSGLLLVVFITFQWVLTLTRTVKKWRTRAMVMQTIHKWAGALSPLFFYIHSMGIGYGYLMLLSYIFFANTILGYFNLDVLKNNSDILFKGWMISHVALSIVVTILMVFHITMVFYYK